MCVWQAVAFGMGGGLLQKVNRDTMSFATKLSHIVYEDGKPADIMKVSCTCIGDHGRLCQVASMLHKGHLACLLSPVQALQMQQLARKQRFTNLFCMQAPSSDSSKSSLPGVLAVKRVNGVPTAFPADSGEVSSEENLLRTVYDCRPVEVCSLRDCGGDLLDFLHTGCSESLSRSRLSARPSNDSPLHPAITCGTQSFQ